MDHQPITATESDDQAKVYFADLRHEVELAARRHAELSSALDIYADELSHIAFAVTGDRDGIIGFDQIVDLVKTVVAERDRLRAVVDEQAASLARLKEFAESEILDRVSAELGADLRAQLDVRKVMGGLSRRSPRPRGGRCPARTPHPCAR